jgi:hypothetical protein
MTITLHFIIEQYVRAGKKYSRFTEKPRKGAYRRGKDPLVYVYSHETGNMTMSHPDLWAKRSIMDRMPSRPKSAVDAIPNDENAALEIAIRHMVHHIGDGMNHSQRQIKAMQDRHKD